MNFENENLFRLPEEADALKMLLPGWQHLSICTIAVGRVL
jgi:hypothetical protein